MVHQYPRGRSGLSCMYPSPKTTIKSWFGLIFNPFIDGVTSFITGAKITLSDEETSSGSKVTGIAKSFADRLW